MMRRVTSAPFVSFAQNAEDVVLQRALGDIAVGRYLEVGANQPTEDSISRSFYDRGWSGITVEPMADLVASHRLERPRDTQVQAVAGRPGVDRAVLHLIAGTGLSTTVDAFADLHSLAGFTPAEVEVASLTVDEILASHLEEGDDLHFVVIDTEGSEADVLAGFDLRRWRPWALVVEATVPNSHEQTHGQWEQQVIDAGYVFCLFDGLSRFYVAEERAADLQDALSIPATALDGYVHHRELALRMLADELSDEVVRWRTAALTRWAQAVGHGRGTDDDRAVIAALRAEIERTHQTVSWRVTAPLRAARRTLAP